MPGLVRIRRDPAGFLQGRARPGTGRHGKTLASFLKSDIQGDIDTARLLLAEVAAAERGETLRPGGAGNAFSVTVTPGGAVIRNAVLAGAAPEPYTLAELRAALEAWITAIEAARSRNG